MDELGRDGGKYKFNRTQMYCFIDMLSFWLRLGIINKEEDGRIWNDVR